MAKKTYGNKKLHQTTNYNNYGDVVKSGFSRWKIVRIGIVCGCIALIIWGGLRIIQAIAPAFQFVADRTTQAVTQQIGTKPTFDEFGSLNVLLMGYGGETHQGGYLTDSIMVASFHPDQGTVTFLSLPRDLRVTSTGYQGKINSFFAHSMIQVPHRTEQDLAHALDQSAHYARDVVENITGLKVPYYALVSFEGFQRFVDELDGVTINVPERLVDNQFPDANMKGFEPLVVEVGPQHMDGTLALKYARSRKSTSDFSRAYRQQQIIQAIIQELKGSINITNLGKINSLYDRYQAMLHTNLSLGNFLYLAQYKDDVNHFSSHVLTYECGKYFTQMAAGCFLTTPPRDWFGGASVLTPAKLRYGSYSQYDDIQEFVYVITHYPQLGDSEHGITIFNAVSPEGAKAYGTSVSGKASDAASTLVQYGFRVDDIDNATEPRPRTMAYVYGTGDYSDTLDALTLFMDVDVYTGDLLTGHTYTSPIELYLGDNFLESRSSTTNNFWN